MKVNFGFWSFSSHLKNKVIPSIRQNKNINPKKILTSKNIIINNRFLKNTKTLNNVTPKIIPTSNSNGYTINNIDYDDGNKNVTITIGASFSDAADYPFEVGKKVMIEGVSVGLGSTGRGYNSENYDYTLFEILATDANIGGTLGTVRYNLSNIIESTIPGLSESSIGLRTKDSKDPISRLKNLESQIDSALARTKSKTPKSL